VINFLFFFLSFRVMQSADRVIGFLSRGSVSDSAGFLVRRSVALLAGRLLCWWICKVIRLASLFESLSHCWWIGCFPGGSFSDSAVLPVWRSVALLADRLPCWWLCEVIPLVYKFEGLSLCWLVGCFAGGSVSYSVGSPVRSFALSIDSRKVHSLARHK
jgi:hypothetical protein